MTAPLLVLAAGSVLDATPMAAIAAAAGAGFDGIGLRPAAAPPDTAWADVARAARDAGVVVHDVEVHRIGDPTTDAASLVAVAATVGADALLVVSDLPDAGATQDALGRLVATCREAGLRAAIEYMAWTTPATPLDAMAMAAAAGAVVVVDVLHHHRVGAGPDELAAIAASGHLGWVQLCDAPVDAPADLVDEARHRRLAPGTGGLPLTTLLAAAPADATISVEVQSDALAATSSPADRARLLHRAARHVLSHRG